MKRNTTTKPGFTLIEMLIVAPTVILIIGIFINVIVSMTGDVLTTRDSNVAEYDIQSALEKIRDDVENSDAFLATNNIDITSPQGLNDDDTSFENISSANGNMLILNAKATTENPLSSINSTTVYAISQPNSCSSVKVTLNLPITYNIVYLVKDNTLWRRVIMDPSYTTKACAETWQQPSCSPGTTGTMCKTEDEKILENLTDGGFDLEYYANEDSTTENSTAVDASKTSIERQSALQLVNSVKVFLNTSSTTAGQNIVKSKSIWASKPYSDSASEADNAYLQIVKTQPYSRTVTATSGTTFSAASSVSSATIQWQFSSDKGSTWNNITNGTSYTYGETYSGATTGTLTLNSSAKEMDGYRYRAQFTNGSNIIYTYSVNLFVNYSTWTNLTLQNDWVTYSSTYGTPGYRKTTAGIVILTGLVKKSTSASWGEVIAQLPVGYRPNRNLVLTSTTSGSASARIEVRTDGNIVYCYGSNEYMSLANVYFYPDTSRYTTNYITTFYNGWSLYSSLFKNPQYIVDSVGRVVMQGVTYPGTYTYGTKMFEMPSEHMPATSTIITTSGNVSTTGYYSKFFFGASAGPYARDIGGDYMSMQAMYYPTSANVTWNSVSFQNSWYNYGGSWSTFGYTKASDGIVTIKGLIKNSTTPASGTVIAQLPSGYRPARRLIFSSSSADTYARIDIDTSGNILFMTGTPTSWLSLENISFYADQ